MIRVKDEPFDHEIIYREAASEIGDDENYYQYESIQSQVCAIWNEDNDDVKPKAEHINIDPNRQLVINLDSGFLRKNYRTKWIELVKSTFRRLNSNKCCQLCKKSIEFDSATKLIEHYADQHQKEFTSYDCTLCDFFCKTKEEIHVHWTKEHKRQHKCKNKYTVKKSLNDRNNIWIGDDEFVHSFYHGKNLECKYCHKFFIRMNYLNAHISSVHLHAPKHECKVCLKEYSTVNYLKSHMERHLENTEEENREGLFNCDICSKVFFQKCKLAKHMRWHITEQKRIQTKNQMVKCEICLKMLKRGKLSDHKKRCRNEKQFECDICGKMFIWKCDLKYHIFKSHIKAKPFKCQYCPKTFSTKSHSKRHEFIHIKNTLPENDPRKKRHNYECELVECEICSKKLQRIYLKGHMRLHTDEKPFECDICHKCFKTKENVKKHKVIHIDGIPFECSFCSKKFKYERDHRQHEQSHRNEQPHACQFCNKKFLFYDKFYLHIRSVHFKLLRQQDKSTGGLNELFQGNRTYECYRCNYAGILRDVKAHMSGVKCQTGSLSFNCPKCIRKFGSRKFMKYHLRITHLN